MRVANMPVRRRKFTVTPKPRQLDVRSWLVLLGPTAVVAAVAYALVRSAYYEFYRPFGVTPEQVGIGAPEFLTQALVGPALAVVLVSLAFLAPVVGARYAWDTLGRGRRSRAALVVVVCVGLVGWTLFVMPGQNLSADVTCGLLLVIGLACVALHKRTRWQEARWLTVGSAKFFALVVALVSAAVVLAVAIYQNPANWATRVLADHESLHGPVFRVAGMPLTLLDVQAVYAEPKWLGAQPAPAPFTTSYAGSTCLFYLGDDDGFSVLYNVNDNTVLRFPANMVALEMHVGAPPGAPCDGTSMSVEGSVTITTGEW